MTNAHRPTWKAAVGGSEQGGNILYIPSRQYSSRDMPSHLSLKTRHEGQGTEAEARKIDFRRDIMAREGKYYEEKQGGKRSEPEMAPDTVEEELPEPEVKYSLDEYIREAAATDKKKHVEDEQTPFPQDEDVDLSGADEEFEQGSKKGEEEGKAGEENAGAAEDEDAELMREFEKIKKEREEDMKKKVSFLFTIAYRSQNARKSRCRSSVKTYFAATQSTIGPPIR